MHVHRFSLRHVSFGYMHGEAVYVGHCLIWWGYTVLIYACLIEVLKTTPRDISYVHPPSFNSHFLWEFGSRES